MPFLAPIVPYIPAILSIGGTIMSARAQREQGQENQDLAHQEADLIIAQTEFEQIGLRREISQIVGKTITAYAGGGVVSSTGSAADVRRDNAIYGDKVALFSRYIGLKEAEITRKGGDVSASQGKRAAAGTLLTGTAQAISLLPE